MLRSLIVCSLLLACSAFEAADPEKPPFNKEELEEILRKDHSDRISNIYDSANDIQCARRPPGHRTSSCNPSTTERRVASPLAGTRGTWIIRCSAPAWMASAQRRSCSYWESGVRAF